MPPKVIFWRSRVPGRPKKLSFEAPGIPGGPKSYLSGFPESREAQKIIFWCSRVPGCPKKLFFDAPGIPGGPKSYLLRLPESRMVQKVIFWRILARGSVKKGFFDAYWSQFVFQHAQIEQVDDKSPFSHDFPCLLGDFSLGVPPATASLSPHPFCSLGEQGVSKHLA
jgi:hypothetical protein